MTTFDPFVSALRCRVDLRGDGTANPAWFAEVAGLKVAAPRDPPPGADGPDPSSLVPGHGAPILCLRRGIIPVPSGCHTWLKQSFEADFSAPIEPRDITITLVQGEHEMLGWSVYQAWPIRWQIAGFKAEQSVLTVDTIELGCGEIRRDAMAPLDANGL